MSFVFPKPTVAESRKKLFKNLEADYDELLVRLSLYAFSRLSLTDQREQVAKITHTVNAEDVQFLEEGDEAIRLRSIFAEHFKKLKFSDQKLFLYKVIQKFTRERKMGELISTFKQLDAEHQQQLIERIVHGTPENLRNPAETEEEFRLRRFTQLSRDYTLHAYYHFVVWKDTELSEEQEETSSDNENGSNWKSCFAEFFFGFSVIWFQGQSASGQDFLIEHLDKGIRGVVIEKRLQEETEEDFKLRRFTELCKNVEHLRIQEQFLKHSEGKLHSWRNSCASRLIGEPLDSDSAAELLSHLWTFRVSLLSANLQQKAIDEMSNQVESAVKTERPLAAATAEAEDHEEAMRIRRLTELFNQVPVTKRIDLFKKLREPLLKAKRYSEAVRVFRGLGSEHQTEIIEYMFYTTGSRVNPAKVIVEKYWGESEEDFRFRAFTKMCIEHLSIWGYIAWPEAYRLQLQLDSASDPYDELLFGVAILWFKAKCANIRRNPIQLILFRDDGFGVGDTIEKLPEESGEDFRLRRFKESFKQLEFTSQERVLDYILDTMSTDVGYPEQREGTAFKPPEGRGSFDPEWIYYKPTNPRYQVAAATTQGQGAGGATTRASVGLGTSQPPSLVTLVQK